MTTQAHINVIASNPAAPAKSAGFLVETWRDATGLGSNAIGDGMLSSVLALASADDKAGKTQLATGRDLADAGVLASDFSAKSAKDSNREAMYKAMIALAVLLFPAKVAKSLLAYSAKKIDGAAMVHGVYDAAGKELSVREWAQKVPSKRAVLKRALEAWIKYRDQAADKRGARATKPWADSRLAELERIVATCADADKFEATGCECDPHQLGAVAALAIAIVKGKDIGAAHKRVNSRLA